MSRWRLPLCFCARIFMPQAQWEEIVELRPERKREFIDRSFGGRYSTLNLPWSSMVHLYPRNAPSLLVSFSHPCHFLRHLFDPIDKRWTFSFMLFHTTSMYREQSKIKQSDKNGALILPIYTCACNIAQHSRCLINDYKWFDEKLSIAWSLFFSLLLFTSWPRIFVHSYLSSHRDETSQMSKHFKLFYSTFNQMNSTRIDNELG